MQHSRISLHKLSAVSFTAFVLGVLLAAGAAAGGAGDADGDGIVDPADNCLNTFNPDQRDTNGDGFGNLCDPDLNNDGDVNFLDLGIMKEAFFGVEPDADLNGDGSVNFVDLGIMKAFFFGQPGPSGAIFWVLPGDGDWEAPENWFPLGPPQPENLVIINLPDDDSVVTIAAGDVVVYAIESEESLVVGDGFALTLTGPSNIGGSLTLAAEATLAAQGPDAVVEVSGPADLGLGSLEALDGGRLTVSGLVDFVGTEDGIAWTADGAGSRLEMPALVSAVNGTKDIDGTLRWDIVATNGGVVHLPQLASLVTSDSQDASSRSTDLIADGAGSAIEMPLLTFMDDLDKTTASALEASNGAAITMHLLSTLGFVHVELDASSTVDLDQVTVWNDGRLTLAGRALALPNLADADSTSFVTRSGSVLTLAGVTEYLTERDGTIWEAEGPGSRIEAPNLFEAVAGVPSVSTTVRLDFSARDGGVVDMPQLHYLAAEDSNNANTRSVDLLADGAGSRLQFPLLEDFVVIDRTGRSSIQATDNAVIEIPMLSELDYLRILLDATSTIDNIEAWTSLTDCDVEISSRTLSLPALSDITSTSIELDGGAMLTLPTVTGFLTEKDVDWIADGPGARLNLPNLTDIVVGVFDVSTTVRMDIEARAGGVVDLPALDSVLVNNAVSANTRNIEFIADGFGSEISMPVLTSLVDEDLTSLSSSRIEAVNSGVVVTPLLTALDNFGLTLDASGGVDIAQITSWRNSALEFDGVTLSLFNISDVEGTSIEVTGGGVVSFPALTSYLTENDNTDWLASGAGSRLEFPALTNADNGVAGVSSTVRWDVSALGGAVIDLPLLGALVVADSNGAHSRNIDLLADGAGSEILMPQLVTFDDHDITSSLGSEIAVSNGGRVQIPLLTEPLAVDFVLDGSANVEIAQITTCVDCAILVTGGSFEFTNLASFDHSEAEARSGGTLALPGVTAYLNDRDSVLWTAEGAGSRLEFASLLDVTIGVVNGSTTVRTDFTAESGGILDLPSVTTLHVTDSGGAHSRNLDVLADGANSRVQLPSLSDFIDDDITGDLFSTITESDSGVVDYPGTANLVNVTVSP